MISAWQPIETAPRDGTHILGYIYDEPDVIWFETSKNWPTDPVGINAWTNGVVSNGGYDCGYNIIEPTHWMPLPEPPQ